MLSCWLNMRGEMQINRLTMAGKFSIIHTRTELSPFCIYTPIAVNIRKGLIQFAKLAIGVFLFLTISFTGATTPKLDKPKGDNTNDRH